MLLRTLLARVGVLSLGVMWATRAWGQPYIDPEPNTLDLVDPALRTKRSAVLGPGLGWGVDATALSGLGVFQDIQVPINRDYDMRADGQKIGEENAEHYAYLLGGQVTTIWRGKNWRFKAIDLNVVRMTPVSGPFETLNSGYTRFDVKTQVEWGMSLGKPFLAVEASAGWRRSEFNNGSDSHFVAALPVGFGASLSFPTWLMRVYGHSALASQFGYSQALLFGGSQILGSKADLQDYGCMGEFRINPSAWFLVGAEIESIRIQIPDVEAYEAFGLTVQDPRKTRDYRQATSSLTLGVRKLF